jgi:hypothetical protein
VLLPVRDGGAFLEQCLASLERQTLTDLEVVAVEDGSGDGSAEVLAWWAGRDPRIRVVPGPAAGLVAALDTGLDGARAPLVARMDSDDVCHPRRLELQVGRLDRDPDLGVVSCLVRIFPRTRVAEGFRVYERWLNGLVTPAQIARERFVESPLAHPSVVVRRELLLAVGGYRDLCWPEDYDLWLRLLAAGARCAKVERRLLFWREHGGRLTRTDCRYAAARFVECKAHHLVRGPLAGCSSVVVWGAGKTGRLLSRELLGLGAPIEAFVDIDPRKVGRRVRGRPVVAPEALPGLLGPGTVVLAAVPARGARDLIRGHLDALGLVEGCGYWCCA